MSDPQLFTTQAELIRRITTEVMNRIGGESNAPASQLPPRQPAPDAHGHEHCAEPCPCCSPSTVAEEEGVCEIFTVPDAQRNLGNGFVPIGISARHCHVTPEQVEILFGKGAKLTPLKPLKQTGQFAAKEVVSIIGPRGRVIERVRILGPCRNETQVEVSLTDCIHLGEMAPVRASGDHHDTPGILIVGPAGHVPISKGLIRANRHIHLQTAEAGALGLKENDTVMVKIDGDKPVIYYDVQVRVSDKFSAEMHLDTDDANAVGMQDGSLAQIIRTAADVVLCGKRAK
ncbi:hypothetical protein BH09SUM1_BH09SUM1_25810 [soil metagenome]